MRPPRILYVVSLYPCWSETFIAREIRALLEAGADVRLLSLKPPSEDLVHPEAEPLLPRVRHPPPPVTATLARLRAVRAHRRALAEIAGLVGGGLAHHPIDLAKSVVALGRGLDHLDWVRDFDPDVIHAHWATFPSTVAWMLARLLDRPFGFTAHAHDIFVNDQLLGLKIEAAAFPVAISRYNVDWLAAHVTPRARQRMTVVHCGVDLPAWPFQPEGRDPDLIVAVGRLDPIKGFEVLIEAVATLARRGRAVRARIIGDGPLWPTLEGRVAELGLGERISFSGAMSQVEVRAAVRAAAIVALPCVVAPDGDRDGIPVSLMEAMASGAPVVSTPISGIPELVGDGREGLLVQPGDPAALARALARLLDDAPLRRGLAEAARAKVEREFDAAAEARKLLALFSTAVR